MTEDTDFPIARATGVIPDEGVPMTGVYLVSWADTEGEVHAGWHLEGDPDFHTILGTMEMAKLRMVADAYDWDRDGD